MAIANQSFSLFAPTFKGVGGELDITTIKAINSDGSAADAYSIGIQTMDENNAFDGETCILLYWAGDGWLKDDFETYVTKGEVTFRTGDAFLVANNGGAGLYFSVNGEVDLVNKNLIPNQAYSLAGNSTPVAFDLTEVEVQNFDGSVADPYAVGFQTMDENNAFDGDTCILLYWAGDGWLKDDFETYVTKGEIPLNPGDAFLIANNAGAELYLSIPSPVKK